MPAEGTEGIVLKGLRVDFALIRPVTEAGSTLLAFAPTLMGPTVMRHRSQLKFVFVRYKESSPIASGEAEHHLTHSGF